MIPLVVVVFPDSHAYFLDCTCPIVIDCRHTATDNVCIFSALIFKIRRQNEGVIENVMNVKFKQIN